MESLKDTSSLVEVLSNKNNCKVLRLRHKETGRDMVLALAIGMGLNIDRVQQLLKTAGHPLRKATL